MASAKKLPSGNWRVNLYVGKDHDGKRLYKSFTASTKKEAEYMAASYNVEKRHKARPADMTVGKAVDQYIETKTAILSPSTLNVYRKLRRLALQSLMPLKLSQITQEDVQIAVNEYAKEHSPKTVRNAHALLTAALAEAAPDFVLHTKLPANVKPEIAVPEDATVQAMIRYVAGTEMETVLLLAAMLGLRRSEIAALTWNDYSPAEKTLCINKAMVKSPSSAWVVKSPKTYAGTRTLTIPGFLADHLNALPSTGEHIVPINPDAITKRFDRLRAHFNATVRLHDLRHYNASVMLALGVPDRYAMERMGHATPNMLRAVYQHTMQRKKHEVANQVNAYFERMQHEMQHEPKESTDL